MAMEIFGYEFRNAALLEEALTTPSFRMSSPKSGDNQRLEFLGDAVLGLLAADRLYAEMPGAKEGELTVRRTQLVSTAALCAAAMREGLTEKLRRNKGAEGFKGNEKTLADAIEAIIGAVWLDGGLAAARQVFEALKLEAHAGEGAWCENPKGELQIRAQAMVPPRHPVYVLIGRTGPSHAPVFTVEVTVEGIGSARASAGTHREAEAQAAAELIRKTISQPTTSKEKNK